MDSFNVVALIEIMQARPMQKHTHWVAVKVLSFDKVVAFSNVALLGCTDLRANRVFRTHAMAFNNFWNLLSLMSLKKLFTLLVNFTGRRPAVLREDTQHDKLSL